MRDACLTSDVVINRWRISPYLPVCVPVTSGGFSCCFDLFPNSRDLGGCDRHDIVIQRERKSRKWNIECIAAIVVAHHFSQGCLLTWDVESDPTAFSPLATSDSREDGPSRQNITSTYSVQYIVTLTKKDPGHLGSEDHRVTESEIAVTPEVCTLYRFGGRISAFRL